MGAWLKRKTPEWRLGALGVISGVMGLVLLATVVFMCVLCPAFRQDLRAEVLTSNKLPEIVTDLHSLVRGMLFGLLPAAGFLFLIVTAGIFVYLRKRQENRP